MSGLGLASFIGSLAESAVLVLMTLTADSLIRGTDEVATLGVTVSRMTAVVLALAAVAARVTLTLLTSRTSARFCSQVMVNAQRALITAYLGSSHATRVSRPPGDLQAVLLTHGRNTGELASSFTLVAGGVCGILAFGGTSLALNPLAMTAISLVGGALILALRPLRKQGRQAAHEFADVTRRVGSAATQIETLHLEIGVFDVGRRVLDLLGGSVSLGGARFRRLRFLSAAVPQLFQAALRGAAVAGLLVVVSIAGDASPDGGDLATIGAIVLLLIRSMSAAQQLVIAHQRVLEMGTYAQGLTDLIQLFESTPREFGEEVPAHLSPIRLKDVDFTYDGATNVLRQLDLEFTAGELVGIVGPSGAGKSTLVELLLRLRPPTAGAITLGGVPIDDIAPAEFARRVAFVPQVPTLIEGTIADNVRFFRDLPDERVRAALDSAHLSAEVDALPDGMQTKVGPDERMLSGGQRQRLTIARALAGDPEILILDEPTSSLDAISENAIRRALDELPSHCLALIVAHRYSTLRSCSRIVVLAHGHLEVDATPEQVAERSSFFKAMLGADD